MAVRTEEIRSTLNDLTQICKDGEQGFYDAAQYAVDLDLRENFRSYSASRAEFAMQLQSEVAKLGGKPETSGTTGGAFHRGWMELREKLSSSNDHALLAEAERGEDAAVKAWRNALSKDFPEDIRELLERQYKAIVQTHDVVREQRDAAVHLNHRTSTSL